MITNRLVLNLIERADRCGNPKFCTQTGLEPQIFAIDPLVSNAGGFVRTLDVFHDGLLGNEGLKMTETDKNDGYSSGVPDFNKIEMLHFADGSGSSLNNDEDV